MLRSAARWGARRALQLELLLAGLIAVLGFGRFDFDEPWYHDVLPATQVPGLLLLSKVGLCCAFGNGLVISDVVMNRYGGLTWVGVPLLFAANALALFALLTAARSVWLTRRTPSASDPLGRAG